jgi:hypothetical protein
MMVRLLLLAAGACATLELFSLLLALTCEVYFSCPIPYSLCKELKFWEALMASAFWAVALLTLTVGAAFTLGDFKGFGSACFMAFSFLSDARYSGTSGAGLYYWKLEPGTRFAA